MLLGWVPIQVVLKLLQVLADSVAQSLAISIVGHMGQVSLFHWRHSCPKAVAS